MADLAQQLAGSDDGEQQSLLLDEIDEDRTLFRGPVDHVANIIDADRRARGRPKGSQNKASRAFADTLMRMGYRHPGLNLAALANADPVQLAAELSQPYKPKSGPNAGEWVESSTTPHDALTLILKANAELLPYFESKQATKVDVDVKQMGVMIIGNMPTDRAEVSKTLDMQRFDEPE